MHSFYKCLQDMKRGLEVGILDDMFKTKIKELNKICYLSSVVILPFGHLSVFTESV